MDNFNSKCPSICPGRSLKGYDVIDVSECLGQGKGLLAERIQVDKGSGFISRVLDKWAYYNGVVLDFSRQGKPMDNPYIESFKGSFRDE